MSDLIMVTIENLEGKKWQAPSNYAFAREDALCPLVLLEVSKAAIHLPIAFSRIDENYLLVAVQGLEPGNNFFVNNKGEWTGGYIPALYRAYPFSLAAAQEHNEVLCVNTESGLVFQNGNSGNSFFETDGEPSKKVKDVFEFLSHIVRNRYVTHKLSDLLQALDLFEPWPIVANKDGIETNVEGLYRINETKFNQLETADIIKLREAGGFPLVYCQLLSMQNLPRIAQQAEPKFNRRHSPPDISFDLSDKGGNISFDDL